MLLWTCISLLTAFGCSSASAQSPVVIGMQGKQCNALPNRNLDGNVIVSGDKNLQNSPQACCAACKNEAGCNVWNYCSKPEGCDDGGRFKQCWLRQNWNVWKSAKTRSAGSNWISGFVAAHCPAAYPDKLLYLQRVNFPSLSTPCQIGTSCTQCMCQLSKALKIAQSDSLDAGLCINNFQTALMFPVELGGAALSEAALDRLSQCPVADPPCQEQKSSTLFATWPLVMPSWHGNDVGAGCQNVDAQTCARLCEKAPLCNAFAYNPFLAGGTCCLKSNPGTDKQIDIEGWQMAWRLPSGTTAEDPVFQEWNPWTNGGSASRGSLTVPSLLDSMSSSNSESDAVDAAPYLGENPTPEGSSCTDVAHPGGFTCQQQKSWNKCNKDYMKNFCNKSCGRCTTHSNENDVSNSSSDLQQPACTCTDVNPNRYICQEEARWNKCRNDFITRTTPDVPEGYCQISCGRCKCEVVNTCKCTDVPPTPWYTCKQQRSWGKCDGAFMRGDVKHPEGYCQVTCGRCRC